MFPNKENRGGRSEYLDRLPRYLYKYRSLSEESYDYTLRLVRDRELFYASPLSLNDPFEGYFAFDREQLIKDVVPEIDLITRKILKDDHAIEIDDTKKEAWHQLETLRLKTRDQFLGKVGIVSLSERFDCPLMWSHYSDSHRGICVEIDLTKILEGHAILPVVYEEQCPLVDLGDFDSMSSGMTESLNRKSPDWSYEKEWRFVRMSGPGVVKVPDETISGVILGSKIQEEHGQEIIDKIKSHLIDCKIGFARRDPFRYLTRVVEVGNSSDGLYRDGTSARFWRSQSGDG